MKLRSPWLIRLAALLIAGVIRTLMSTIRYRVVFLGCTHPVDPREQRYIYAFWHESMLLPTVVKTQISVLISQHADGELIAQACQRLGIGAVRGSSTRGGGEAILELLKTGQHRHLAMTPDGPRGPRRRVQMGTIFLASHSGLPIVPFGVAYQRAWRFRSWDRFALPKPWSRAFAVVGQAMTVPPRLDRPEMERYRRLLEEQMLELTAAAERWAETGTPPSLKEEEKTIPHGLHRRTA
jgi:lysophospholipid acyltransferase (LPLAT)-like uncharacterized protein